MLYYISMIFASMFTYILIESHKRELSVNPSEKNLYLVTGVLGALNILVFTIYSMFHLVWWKPPALLFACAVLAAPLGSLFNTSSERYTYLISIVGLLICSYLMWSRM